jgi:hypothetical protein
MFTTTRGVAGPAIGLALVALLAMAAGETHPGPEVPPAIADAQETSLLQVDAQEMEESFKKARAVVKKISKEIGDSNEAADSCGDLSEEEQSTIEEEVDTEQEILEDIVTTTECDNLGQENVKKFLKLKITAKLKLQKAKKCKAKADTTPVPFAQVPISQLKKGNCRGFFKSPGYIKIKEEDQKCEKEKDKFTGEFTAAVEMVETAQKEAAEETNQCRCEVRKRLVVAFKRAQQSTSKHKQAWARSHHMLCVLKNIPSNKCKVPAVPVVKMPTLKGPWKTARCDDGLPTEPVKKAVPKAKVGQKTGKKAKPEAKVGKKTGKKAKSSKSKEELELQ